MQTPTLNIIENSDQHLRFLRTVVERIQGLEGHTEGLREGLANLPAPADPMQWLKDNGQQALATLNVDPGAATAKTNIADSSPTVDDDSTRGYGYFSQWINTATANIYKCTDPSPGAAVWKLIS